MYHFPGQGRATESERLVGGGSFFGAPRSVGIGAASDVKATSPLNWVILAMAPPTHT